MSINTNLIKIGTGPTHDGAFHRAIAVARNLHKAGLWDGQTSLLIINEPYNLHRRLCEKPPVALLPGVNYEIQDIP